MFNVITTPSHFAKLFYTSCCSFILHRDWITSERSLNQKHSNWRFNDARNSWHSQLSIKLSCAIRDVGRDICHLFVFLRLCRCLRGAESTGNLVGYVLCGFRTASLCSQYFPALINDEHSTAGLLGGFSLEAYRANEAI